MASKPFQAELDLALRAVHRASLATKKIQQNKDKGVSDKSDASPVTVADFAAQALLICAINAQFPKDVFIAEESSEMLQSNPKLLDRVWDLVSSMANVDDLPMPATKEEMMNLIDLGGSESKPTQVGSNQRLWILDPVDGTKTFMSGQQYAVCLCMLENGVQKVAVLGCPNLAYDPTNPRVEEDFVDKTGNGLVLAAVAGQGSFYAPLDSFSDASARNILRLDAMPPNPQSLRFMDSASSSHVSYPHHTHLYRTFFPRASHFIENDENSKPWPTDVWSMQMKYVSLALNSADAIFRIPGNPDFRACVWDHAGGQLILEEAGGKVTDSAGGRFDFTKGREFAGTNWGYIAARSEAVHKVVLEAVRRVIEDGIPQST